MKKQNQHRQQVLQRKRTKRNQSRKGVKYNPNKLLALQPQNIIQAGQTAGPISDETRIEL